MLSLILLHHFCSIILSSVCVHKQFLIIENMQNPQKIIDRMSLSKINNTCSDSCIKKIRLHLPDCKVLQDTNSEEFTDCYKIKVKYFRSIIRHYNMVLDIYNIMT